MYTWKAFKTARMYLYCLWKKEFKKLKKQVIQDISTEIN